MSSNSNEAADAGSCQLPVPKTKITNAQIAIWGAELKLSEIAVAQIRLLNASDPVRVGNGSRAVRGWFPSSIMDCMLGFESRTCELAFLWLRHSVSRQNADRPKMVLCQPCFLDIDGVKEDGSRSSFKYPPDFFELTDNWAGYVECKWEEELENALDPKHEKYAPWRYEKIAAGQWVSRPGEIAAARHGLRYRIWVMSRRKAQLIANLQFLAQYLESPTDNFSENVACRIQAIVKGDPGIQLRNIQATLGDDDIDTLFFCIAKQSLYIDIEREPLSPNFTARVFLNRECAEATMRMEECAEKSQPAPNGCMAVIIGPGTQLSIEGKSSEIVRHIPAENYLELRDAETGAKVTMTSQELEDLVVTGKAHQTKAGFSEPADFMGAMEEWRKVEAQEWAVMHRLFEKIERFLKPEAPGSRRSFGAPTRNQFRHIQKCRDAAARYGRGFEILGLRPKARSGNRNAQLDDATLRIIADAIQANYTTAQAPSVELVWGICVSECEGRIPPLKAPSRTTVRKHIERVARVKRISSRQGSKAAYSIDAPFWNDACDDLPVDGEFAWAVAHIDHTLLDVETAPTADGLSLGRPWLTMMVAPRQKRVLAFSLSYEPPSYRSCMSVIEECVRQHHRLPAVIVTDGGKEFSGDYFSQLLARFKIVQMFRPPVKPRFGAYLERFNGKINSKLIHNLPGNTKLTVRVRMLVTSHNPKNLATLTLEDLEEALAAFNYGWLQDEPDPITGRTPKQKYQEDLRLGGPRTHMMIVPTQEFYVLTCPSTKAGVVKVRRDGVKVNYLHYYCRQFREPGVQDQKLPVRYNPRDLSQVYVRIKGKWVACVCRRFRNEFKGLSERELRFATTMLLGACRTLIEKRRKINAGRLAQFFKEHGLSPEVQKARERAEKNAEIEDRRKDSKRKKPVKPGKPKANTKPKPAVVGTEGNAGRPSPKVTETIISTERRA